jgi:hypothetical protein
VESILASINVVTTEKYSFAVQNISLVHTGLKQSGPTCCTQAGTGARPAKEVGQVVFYGQGSDTTLLVRKSAGTHI